MSDPPTQAFGSGAATFPGASVGGVQGSSFINVNGDLVQTTYVVSDGRGGGPPVNVIDMEDNLDIASARNSWRILTFISVILQAIINYRRPTPPPIIIEPPEEEAPSHQQSPTISELGLSQLDWDSPMSSLLLSETDPGSGSLSSNPMSGVPNIYLRSMLDVREGYPLYEPEPDMEPLDYWKQGVRVGDVGLITQDGGFDFIFNVCMSSEESLDPQALPDNFETLRPANIRVKKHFTRDTHLLSNGVSQVQTSPIVGYKCPTSEGAVLELPDGATRFEAKNKLVFRDLAARYAKDWYRYAISIAGRDAPNGSLYIVTGCIKCRNWGIAVFDRTSASQDYLRFVRYDDPTPTLNLPSMHRWESLGSVRTKTGPELQETADGYDNQCIFLRGYKIMLQGDECNDVFGSTSLESSTMGVFSPPSKSTTAMRSHTSSTSASSDSSPARSPSSNSHRFGQRMDNLSPMNTVVGRVIVEDNTGVEPPIHPSDIINAMLLQHEPVAKVAVTHDDDWRDILPNYPSTTDEWLRDAASKYASHIDQYGCVSLVKFSHITSITELTQIILSPDWVPKSTFICLTTDFYQMRQDFEILRQPDARFFYFAHTDFAPALSHIGWTLKLSPTSFGGIRLPPAIPPPPSSIPATSSFDGICLHPILVSASNNQFVIHGRNHPKAIHSKQEPSRTSVDRKISLSRAHRQKPQRSSVSSILNLLLAASYALRGTETVAMRTPAVILAQPATCPPFPSITLTHIQFPWNITLTSPNPSTRYVSLGDVLSSISRFIKRTVEKVEAEDNLSRVKEVRLSSAFVRLCNTTACSMPGSLAGLKYFDYFGERPKSCLITANDSKPCFDQVHVLRARLYWFMSQVLWV